MIEICDKILEVAPRTLDEIFTLEEKLEEAFNNKIKVKFLNRESVNYHVYYYYLLNNKYILHLYFKDHELRYIAIKTELPYKKIICEKDLEA